MSRHLDLSLERGLALVKKPAKAPDVIPVPDLSALVLAEVKRAMAAIPRPVSVPALNGKDGRDGIDGHNGQDGMPGLDGRDGINGAQGVGLSGVSLVNDDIVFSTTDGMEHLMSIIPIVERVIESIQLPDIDGNFLKLDKSQPFKLDGNKLMATRASGESFAVMTLPESKGQTRGGGISGQRARAISREISFYSTATDYTAAEGDDVIECDTSGGDVTITVPSGRKSWLHVKRSGAGSVEVITEDGSLIEGEACRILNVNLWAVRIAWNGSEYREF